MNISEMSIQEKSVMIVELTKKRIGWSITDTPPTSGYIIKLPDGNTWTNDVYHPQNMALAWRVLNWAMGCEAEVEYRPLSPETEPFKQPLHYSMSDWFYEISHIAGLPPGQAQAAFLDQILELAIEAGLVETAVTEAQP